MELFVFTCASIMVLVGALGVIFRKHPVHAALSLVLTLFGIAVLFVAQSAEFLAAVQVIVYAGAIVILFLFVIMLLGVDKAEDLRVEPLASQRWIAAWLVWAWWVCCRQRWSAVPMCCAYAVTELQTQLLEIIQMQILSSSRTRSFRTMYLLSKSPLCCWW